MRFHFIPLGLCVKTTYGFSLEDYLNIIWGTLLMSEEEKLTGKKIGEQKACEEPWRNREGKERG
jgi:hypothetical protein